MSEAEGRAAAVPSQPGMAQVFAEQFSLEKALGGPREMIEAVLPMTLFSVVYGLGAPTRTALTAAIVPAVGFAVWRLARRQPVTHALSGLIGIALGAYLAVRTGRAENFILPSLVKNSVQAVVFGISALTPWPIVGLVVAMLRDLRRGLDWLHQPARLRAYRQATGVWAGMFGVRLAVQVPLWLAGAAAVLGLANVVLGLPLFATVLWLTWMIVREHHEEPVDPASDEPLAPRAEPGPVRPDASPG
jgi:hypothetical protein